MYDVYFVLFLVNCFAIFMVMSIINTKLYRPVFIASSDYLCNVTGELCLSKAHTNLGDHLCCLKTPILVNVKPASLSTATTKLAN